jgi:hypothetical protein
VSHQLTGILAVWGASLSTLVFIFIVALVVILGRKVPR